MSPIHENELKKIEFEILKDVAQFCEAHQLRYYLGGGTLLGAIRHQGFIPWDDDIDLMMPRPDYIRFHQLYNERDSYFRVHSLFTDKQWYSTFAEVEDTRTVKVYKGFDRPGAFGVTIDIFPIDGSPEEEFSRKIFWTINNVLARIATLSFQTFTVSRHFADQDVKNSQLKTIGRTVAKFIAIPIARCFRPFHLNGIVTKRAMRYDVDHSEYIGVSTFPHYGYRECIRGNPFLKMKKRKFETCFFNTPEYYEEYLRNLYGDYRKLPPKEKQVSHHDFHAYWKEGIL